MGVNNNTQNKINKAFKKVKDYCEDNQLKGYDPYDGLTSPFLKFTPFAYHKIGRLAWIQFFKRSNRNYRKLFAIKKDYNPKALGLFLNGYCNLYRQNPNESLKQRILELSDQIIDLRTKGFDNHCWGYNFPWQSRVFYQPAYSPTIIASSFVSLGLLDAYEITKEPRLLASAESTCRFILEDLNKNFNADNDVIFSYSPFDQTQVYNASLLGARLLSKVYSLNKDENLANHAKSAVNFVVKEQAEDGSWIYGKDKVQTWIDSFHTGYNLEAIYDYMQNTGDFSFQNSFDLGLKFYLENFFLEDGHCKYYHHQMEPFDIHCPAQLLILLSKTGKVKDHESLVSAVINRVIDTYQDSKGFFYYRSKNGKVNKTPYMRWAQAWMFVSLSLYLRRDNENSLNNEHTDSLQGTAV